METEKAVYACYEKAIFPVFLHRCTCDPHGVIEKLRYRDRILPLRAAGRQEQESGRWTNVLRRGKKILVGVPFRMGTYCGALLRHVFGSPASPESK